MPLARFITLFVVISSCFIATSLRAELERLNSPFYGGVLFQFNQQKYFSSIIELEKGLSSGRLGEDITRAETLLGSLYLSYGLHRHAQTIFERVLDTSVDEKSRDLAWFYLSKIQYQRGFYQQAKVHLEKITAPLPSQFEDERLTLKALVLLQSNDLEGAIEHLNQVIDDEADLNYSRYNLAVAMLGSGKPDAAMNLLIEAAALPKLDAESAALIDRVNIALGFHYLQQEEFALAKTRFSQVELHGPFSTQALLGLGWSAFGLNEFGSATAAWRELVARDASDPSVLEGYLALPFLSYQVQNYNASLADYQKAIAVYEKELEWLNKELEREDLSDWIVTLLDLDSRDEIGWRWQGEVLSGSLLNPYMLNFSASHRFQEMLKNYRDLLFIEKNLNKWRNSLDVYSDIIDVKTAAYASLMPKAKQRLNDLSDQSTAKTIERLSYNIQMIEENENALALVTSSEQKKLAQLRSIDYRLSYNLHEFEDKLDEIKLVDRAVNLQEKHALLEGVLKWDVMTSYKQRIWRVNKELAELEKERARSLELSRDILAVMKAVPESFDGHAQRLASIDTHLNQSLSRTMGLRIQHEAYLRTLIKDELLAIKNRIEIYRSQALLSIAHIYDMSQNLNEAQQ